MDKTIMMIKAPHEGAFYGKVDDVNNISLTTDMLEAFHHLRVDVAKDFENTLVLATSEPQPFIMPQALEWDKAGLQPNDIPSLLLDSYGGAKEQILKNMDDISGGVKILNVVAADIFGTALDFTITFYDDRKEGESRAYAVIHAGGKTLVGIAVSKTVAKALTGAISAGLSTKHIPNTKLGLVTKVLISTGGAISGAMIANAADDSLEKIAESLTSLAEKSGGNTALRMEVIDPDNRQQKGLVNIIPKRNGQVNTQVIDGVVNVKEHTRDGHKVQSHQRTRPDNDLSNNLNYRG